MSLLTYICNSKENSHVCANDIYIYIYILLVLWREVASLVSGHFLGAPVPIVVYMGTQCIISSKEENSLACLWQLFWD